jgi:hypothetical protein
MKDKNDRTFGLDTEQHRTGGWLLFWNVQLGM